MASNERSQTDIHVHGSKYQGGGGFRIPARFLFLEGIPQSYSTVDPAVHPVSLYLFQCDLGSTNPGYCARSCGFQPGSAICPTLPWAIWSGGRMTSYDQPGKVRGISPLPDASSLWNYWYSSQALSGCQGTSPPFNFSAAVKDERLEFDILSSPLLSQPSWWKAATAIINSFMVMLSLDHVFQYERLFLFLI